MVHPESGSAICDQLKLVMPLCPGEPHPALMNDSAVQSLQKLLDPDYATAEAACQISLGMPEFLNIVLHTLP